MKHFVVLPDSSVHFSLKDLKIYFLADHCKFKFKLLIQACPHKYFSDLLQSRCMWKACLKHSMLCLYEACDEPPIYRRLLLDLSGQQFLVNLINFLPDRVRCQIFGHQYS